MMRNRSEQMSKKPEKENIIKSTKSQNLKKKREKLIIGDPNLPINESGNSQFDDVSENNRSQDEYEEDEPTLPVFKHKSNPLG